VMKWLTDLYTSRNTLRYVDRGDKVPLIKTGLIWVRRRHGYLQGSHNKCSTSSSPVSSFLLPHLYESISSYRGIDFLASRTYLVSRNEDAVSRFSWDLVRMGSSIVDDFHLTHI
jgi:hypothetical protein